MYYNEIAGVKVSALGLGNMRLPKVEGQGEKIDREKAQEIVDYAMSHGITYFDTAYRYHGGESELFLGEAMNLMTVRALAVSSAVLAVLLILRCTGCVLTEIRKYSGLFTVLFCSLRKQEVMCWRQ